MARANSDPSIQLMTRSPSGHNQPKKDKRLLIFVDGVQSSFDNGKNFPGRIFVADRCSGRGEIGHLAGRDVCDNPTLSAAQSSLPDKIKGFSRTLIAIQITKRPHLDNAVCLGLHPRLADESCWAARKCRLIVGYRRHHGQDRSLIVKELRGGF